MAFALLIIGITLVVAAVRGTHDLLLSLLKKDFSGPGNFVWWIAALLIIGAIGYVNRLKPLSDGLLVIVLLVLFLSRGNPRAPQGGFFQQFLNAIQSTNTPTTGSTSGVSLGGNNVGIGRGGVNVGLPPITIGV